MFHHVPTMRCITPTTFIRSNQRHHRSVLPSSMNHEEGIGQGGGGSLCSLHHPVLRGQLISLLIAGTGVFATILSDDFSPSANYPTFMNALNYACLSVYMIRRLVSFENYQLIRKPWKDIELSNSIYFYMFAAFLDVEANFLVITAYNYTSITSIMMLDCFTIPSAMFLSYYFLRARYQLRHACGIFVCLSGLACIVLSDVKKTTTRIMIVATW